MVRSPVAVAGWLLSFIVVVVTGCGNPTTSPSTSSVPEEQNADPPSGSLLVGGVADQATAIDTELVAEVERPALPFDPVEDENAASPILPTSPTEAAVDETAEPPPEASASFRAPATVRQAAALLDLRTFPLLPGAEESATRSIAQASYEAPGGVEAAYRFLLEHLEQRDWKEMEGGYVTEQAATGTLTREGFKVSVSVFASSSEGEGKVRATLIQHGNVATEQLPLPPNTTSLYQTPVSSAGLTDQPVEETRETIASLLMDQGWSPYGEAGDTQSFRQNAVKLLVRVTAAPAQGGKTLIDYSSQLMSAEIPLPPRAVKAHYSDAPTQLAFDTEDDYESVTRFYVETLAKQLWKPTTERLVNIDRRDYLIFRNPDQDLFEIELTRVGDVTRVLARYQTADEVLAVERRLQEERQRREALASQPLPRVGLKLPAEARDVEMAATRLEFTATLGEGRRTVHRLRDQLAEGQWEVESASDEPMFGSVVMRKGDQRVTLTYVESGVLPPDITVTARGAELELVAELGGDGD